MYGFHVIQTALHLQEVDRLRQQPLPLFGFRRVNQPGSQLFSNLKSKRAGLMIGSGVQWTPFDPGRLISTQGCYFFSEFLLFSNDTTTVNKRVLQDFICIHLTTFPRWVCSIPSETGMLGPIRWRSYSVRRNGIVFQCHQIVFINPLLLWEPLHFRTELMPCL